MASHRTWLPPTYLHPALGQRGAGQLVAQAQTQQGPDFASGQAVWSLCDSTAGVISQIDNMVSGLVQPPTQTQPQADSVQEDAARYRWLREGNDAKHGAAWHVAVNLYGCEWDAAIDAARKQGARWQSAGRALTLHI